MTEPPLPLDTVARAFWDRHHARLTAAGLLTDADHDSFAVLAMTWSKLAEVSAPKEGGGHFRDGVQLNQLLKQYQAYAREFGLMPATRKRTKLDTERPPAKDEFGI